MKLPAFRRGLAFGLALAVVRPLAALSITRTVLPPATVGIPYSFALTASGGTPPYAWNFQSGGLPTGLNVTPAGVIAGTPAPEGTWAYGYPFGMYLTVADATGATAGVTLTLTLQPPGSVPPGPSAVTYAGNGAVSGYAPVDPNDYAAGSPVTVPGNLGALFNPGHAFIGWNTAADGSGTSLPPGATFVMGSGPAALQAQWNNQNWPVSVWGGARDAITLRADGTVWTWGDNQHGEMGNGNKFDQPLPVEVEGPGGAGYLSGIVAVMGGESHNLALRNDGTVWAWGMGSLCQLGNGGTADSPTPVQVQGLTAVTQLASRAYHSLAVKSDGTVWAWGYDFHGALGIGVANSSNTAYPAPVQVQGLNQPIMVTGGYCFSVALLQDHTLVAWGNNGNGELGDGTNHDHYVPAPVQGISDVIWVSAGWGQVLAVKADGTVWAWGANSWSGAFAGAGLLGDGTTTDRWLPQQVPGLTGAIQAMGGDSFSAVLLKDGSVWTFGSNAAGQLGTGSLTPAQSLVPVQVPGMTNVVALAARDHHMQVLRGDGTIWSWGSGENGELGNNTWQNSAVPVPVQYPATAVVSPPPPPPPPPASSSPLAIPTQGLATATAGVVYSQPLVASGGKAPYTWALLAGSFPQGLSLTPGGMVTGTPEVLGAWAYQYPYLVYVQVTDASGAVAAASLPITLLPP